MAESTNAASCARVRAPVPVQSGALTAGPQAGLPLPTCRVRTQWSGGWTRPSDHVSGVSKRGLKMALAPPALQA